METGNGVSRSPSPTEKHNAPIITAKTAADTTREPIVCENLFIGNSQYNRLNPSPPREQISGSDVLILLTLVLIALTLNERDFCD